jgi:hypothetical protein
MKIELTPEQKAQAKALTMKAERECVALQDEKRETAKQNARNKAELSAELYSDEQYIAKLVKAGIGKAAVTRRIQSATRSDRAASKALDKIANAQAMRALPSEARELLGLDKSEDKTDETVTETPKRNPRKGSKATADQTVS